MKKLLSLILVLTMIMSIFVGCSDSSNEGSTNAPSVNGTAEEPTLADKYSTTYDVEVQTLNPLTMQTNTSYRVMGNTTDGLVENDKYGQFVPSVAESWTHNDDFTVWTFKLRQGIKWVDHTGAETEYEVTAQDFIESLRYIADPRNDAPNFGIIRPVIVGLKDYNYNLWDIEDGIDIGKTREEVLESFDSTVGVKAIDPYTLEYTLTAPTPYFISYLVTEMFLPVNGEFLATVGEDFGLSKESMLYNGAYYLSDWQRDKQIVLLKNENYWDKDKISVSEVTLQKVEDAAVRAQMFQRGEISSASLEGSQVGALQNGEWGQYINLSELSSVNYWFALNFQSLNPEFQAFIQNENFRKALYHGIDRVLLSSLYNPIDPDAILRNTIVPENVINLDGKDYTDYPELVDIKNANTFDATLAQEYMQKAIDELVDDNGNIKGVTPQTVDMLPVASFDIDGKLPVQITFSVSNSSDDGQLAALLAQMLSVNLGEGNVVVEQGRYVDNKYGEVIQPGRFDITYDSFSFRFADPIAQLGRLVTDGGVNDGGYSDSEFDALVEKADTIYDLNERYTLFAQAEALLIDRAYIIPWQSGGGDYEMTKIVPFTAPRGGFGITRFKYKGMVVEEDPITTDRYEELKIKFYEELENLN